MRLSAQLSHHLHRAYSDSSAPGSTEVFSSIGSAGVLSSTTEAVLAVSLSEGVEGVDGSSPSAALTI